MKKRKKNRLLVLFLCMLTLFGTLPQADVAYAAEQETVEVLNLFLSGDFNFGNQKKMYNEDMGTYVFHYRYIYDFSCEVNLMSGDKFVARGEPMSGLTEVVAYRFHNIPYGDYTLEVKPGKYSYYNERNTSKSYKGYFRGTVEPISLPENASSDFFYLPVMDERFVFQGIEYRRTKEMSPGGIKDNEAEAFGLYDNKKNVYIPSTVTSEGTTYQVTSIAYNAFPRGYSGNRIKLVRIPEPVVRIGPNAFYECENLETVIFSPSSSLTHIYENAFSECISLKEISLPHSLTNIGNDAFSGCTSLTTAKLDEVEAKIDIPDRAFSGCSSLTSIELPASLNRIGANAFEGCSSLTSLTLPQTLTSIGANAFNSSSRLNRLYFTGQEAPDVEENAFSNVSAAGTLYYPFGSDYSKVKAALPEGWTASDASYNLSGQVRFDEAVQSGVIVQLLQGDKLVADTASDGNGSFSFSGVFPGNYTIQVLPYTSGGVMRYGSTKVTVTNANVKDIALNLQSDKKEVAIEEVKQNGSSYMEDTTAITIKMNQKILPWVNDPDFAVNFKKYFKMNRPDGEKGVELASATAVSPDDTSTIVTLYLSDTISKEAVYTLFATLPDGGYTYAGQVSNTRFFLLPLHSSNYHHEVALTGFDGYFPNAPEDYSSQEAQTITIENLGDAPFNNFSISLKGANPEAFTLGDLPASGIGVGIGVGNSASFTITPADNLKEDVYTATVEVEGMGITASKELRFIVGDAQPPLITIDTQPQDVTFTRGSISGELSVKASVTKGAALSYQWYENSTADNTNGTAIDGATEADFPIPAGLGIGKHYYFCEVRATAGADPIRSAAAAVTVNQPLYFIDSDSYDIPPSNVGTSIAKIDVSGGVSGGQTPYTFTANGLPKGISISEAGIISGTPSETAPAGTATITVKDAAGVSMEITINYGAITRKQVEAPAFTPKGGTYESPQSVKITCATEGADIYYTTDGSAPTVDSTKYTGTVRVSETTVLKAIALKSGMKNSEVAESSYTIQTTPEHTHTLIQVAEKAATCAENGNTEYYTCKDCGKYFSDSKGSKEIEQSSTIIQATGLHTSEGDWQHDTQNHWKQCSVCSQAADKAAHSGGTAGCSQKAVCEVCSVEYGSLNPDHHDGDTELRGQKDATETEDGYTGDTYCLGCNNLLQTGEVIPKQPGHTHEFSGDWQSDDTHHWHECTVLGCPITENSGKDGYGLHSESEWITTKQPTETDAGSKKKECTTCGFELAVEIIPAISSEHTHTLILVAAKEATCVENGHTEYYTCEGCGKYFSDSEGVNEIELSSTIIQSTKLHTGEGDWQHDTQNHWKRCSVCNQVVDKAAHSGGTAGCSQKAVCEVCSVKYGSLNPAHHDGDTELRGQKDATETEDGYTGDTYCLGCNNLLQTGEVIPKQPNHTHEFGGDWQTDDTHHWQLCTAGDGEVGSKAAHTASGWIDDKDLKENELSKQHQECTVCGYTMITRIVLRAEVIKDFTVTTDGLWKFYGPFKDLTALRLNGVKLGIEPQSDTLYNLTYPGYKGIAGIAKEGSVEVTLYADFLKTLPAGKYTLEAEFASGKTTSTSSSEFTVTDDDKPAPKPSNRSDASATGDSRQLYPWILMMLTALTGGILLTCKKKKEEK